MEHILLADDDKDHGILFRKLMLKEHPEIKVSWVGDGEQLIQFLHLYQVDLLFLDLQMPCKNGYECLDEIKKDKALKDLPVIVYSSSAQMTDIQKSFVHQADLYLVKPFKTDHLQTALNQILSINWKNNPSLKHYYFINNRFVPYTATA